jgi:hypothetical protein
VTWIDEDGTSYTRTGSNFNFALLNIGELKTIWASDLRLSRGDFDFNRSVNAHDIDLLFANRGNADYDLDGDGDADQGDVDYIVRTILRTEYGDANLDRHVDLADFTYLAANFNGTSKGWADGDFSGDGKVDLTDFTLLAANFNFVAAPTQQFAATVPEPQLGLLAGLFLISSLKRRERKRHRWQPASSDPTDLRILACRFT